MTSARSIVLSAALEAGESWPTSKRVQLLRAISEFAGTPEASEPFNKLADDLEAADRRCREFAFRIQTGARSQEGTR